jgi:hypothetical protein
MSWTKAQREKAKCEGLVLVSLLVEPRPGKVKMAFTGFSAPVSPELAREVERFLLATLKKHAATLKAGEAGGSPS